MVVPDGTPRPRKRQRDGLESLHKESPEDPPSAKRTKLTSEAGTYRWHRTPSFWNRLSKVHLTRGALREFDHRTSRAEQPVSIPRFSTNTSFGPGTKSVKRFARHGGPDLTHIRGYAILTDQNDNMSQPTSRKRSSTSGGSDTTRKSKSQSRSSYDPTFEQNLIDGGIYPHDQGSEPKNVQEIKNYMARSRASLSPSRFGDKDFKEFTTLCNKAGDEASARAEIMSIIAGEGRKQQIYACDRVFNHLEPLAEDLPQPKPDLYDGALPQRIDRRVRRELGKQIVPCNNTSLPAAPNFFLEGKSEGGRADVAKRQACHDGAVGARVIHNLQNYNLVDTAYDNNANSYSSTFHPGTATLQVYGHHVTAPNAPGQPPEYHMTQLNAYAITGNIDYFKAGAAGFRNLRDLAKSVRDNCIEHANQRARRAPADTSSTTLTDSRTSVSVQEEDESDTSTDELAAEQRTSKRTRHATPA
ncbi:MAG: hypothetical protein Q9171_006997 [Xanthocarpia ochracea]